MFGGKCHELSGSVCCKVVHNISMCLEQADEGADSVSKLGVGLGVWSGRDVTMTEKKGRGWREGRKEEEGGGGGGRRR